MTPIMSNKLNVKFDYAKIDELYDVFCITTDKKHFKFGAMILDIPLLEKNICSICYESGKTLFILMKHNLGNKQKVKKSLSDFPEFDTLTIAVKKSSDLPKETLLQLLFNSLANFQSDELKFNNLSGHLYCFNSSWLKHRDYDYAIMKIPCLEIKIAKNCFLQFNVHTFTSEELRSKMKFGKTKFEDYPKYVLSACNTLRRKSKDDKEKAYIMRQAGKSKTEIPFMDIKNFDKFDQSKIGVVVKVLEQFQKRFSDCAEIEFETIPACESEDYTSIVAKENKAAILSRLENVKIKIVDCIDEYYSQDFAKEIKKVLLEKYSLKSTIGKRISKECFNIRIIHNEGYYNENDPHNDEFDGVVVQHITYEDFGDNIKAGLSTVINELLIKDDLNRKQITLFDWKTLDYDNDITFGVRAEYEGIEKYYFMVVHNDGTFEICEEQLDLFNQQRYSEYVRIYSDSKDVCGMIIDHENNINVIRKTGWITIPEIFKIKNELLNGNTKIRGKEKRDELMSSVLDIKTFKIDDEQYYFSGMIGNGMHWTINKAANIRKIESVGKSSLMFNKLLKLMNVTFVRNGQLTVIPFPFKYLREYINAKTK